MGISIRYSVRNNLTSSNKQLIPENPYRASVSNLGSNYGGGSQSPEYAHKRINSSISRYGSSTQAKGGARQYLNMSMDHAEGKGIEKQMADFDRKMRRARDRKLEKQK